MKQYKLGSTIWEEKPENSGCFQSEQIDLGGSFLGKIELERMGAKPTDTEFEELPTLDPISTTFEDVIDNRIAINKIIKLLTQNK